jgi:hypothetical protein
MVSRMLDGRLWIDSFFDSKKGISYATSGDE